MPDTDTLGFRRSFIPSLVHSFTRWVHELRQCRDRLAFENPRRFPRFSPSMILGFPALELDRSRRDII